MYQYVVVIALLLISVALASYYVIFIAVSKYTAANKRNAPPSIGYVQWKEEDAAESFPVKGKCSLYDFGVSTPTLESNVLDKMLGRKYRVSEICTDSNQIYAAKVRRVCHQYVDGTKSIINRCVKSGTDERAKVGDESFVYSSLYCNDKGKKDDCKGFVAEVFVGGRLLLAPSISTDHKSNRVVPVTKDYSKLGTDSIYRVTRYNTNGKTGDLGKYATFTHKSSGTTLSPGNATTGGALWRLLYNSPYFKNPKGGVDLRMVYVGRPSSSDWKNYPESDEQFAVYANSRWPW